VSARRPRPAARFRATLRRWRAALALPGTPTEQIHTARVTLKEARAILRLLRTLLPPSTSRRWQTRLRTAMKSLAPARDRTIVRAVLEAQIESLPSEVDRTPLVRVLPRPRSAPISASTLRRVPQLLDDFEKAVVPALAATSWEAIDDAFHRLWRRVRRLQSQARHTRSPEHWHRWRRRVKALAYQADFAHPPSPDDWKALRQKAWRLQSLLGDLQDIHVTLDAVEQLNDPAPTLNTLRSQLRRAARKARKRAWKARLKKP